MTKLFNLSIIFTQTCINERLLPKYTKVYELNIFNLCLNLIGNYFYNFVLEMKF